MTPGLWRKVREVLYGALELPPEERCAYLDRECANQPELRSEVESLLRASDPTTAGLLDLSEDDGAEPHFAGTTIGPYRLLEEIGRGGMGTVYVAVRDDGQYEHQVAVKLVKRGMDTDALLRRFRYERQILAFLNHPNIASLLDGGTTAEGRPYFVMEYVQGQPLLAYCRRAGLDVAARLRLFMQVCSAVEHAHRNLIVHRDVKPGNILVTREGVPKLLDFGIARILVPDSQGLDPALTVGPRFFTPDYASPEQVRGQPVNTATDIYSLGAVLYELLSGQKAHSFRGATDSEKERMLCEVDPPRPSTVVLDEEPGLSRRALEGDLDRIVMKALQKEPAQRYSSVEQFSCDIGRHLAGLPVLAREATIRYRASRFVRRHKGSVTAAAMVVLSLIAGLGATVWQAHVARTERDRAQQRFQDVRRLANSFLVEHDTLAALPGGTGIRANLIVHSLEYLDRLAHESSGDATLQQELAAAYEKMGDVQGRADRANVGDTAGALASYRKSLAIREALAAADPRNPKLKRDLANSLARLSGALKISGDYMAGLQCDQKALQLREALLASEPGNREYRRLVAESCTTLGGSLFQVSDWDGVLKTRRRALALYEELAGSSNAGAADFNGLALAQTRMGSILSRNGDKTAALRFANLAVSTSRDGLRRFPRDATLTLGLGTALGVQARVQLDRGEFDQAIASLREAHGIYTDMAAADPQDFRSQSLLATSHHRLGRAYLRRGQIPQARQQLLLALSMRENLAEAHALNAGARGEIAESYGALGDVAARLNQKREALGQYRKATEILNSLVVEGRANSASREELARITTEMIRLQE